MYANVNYLVNAWVSGNTTELFRSSLSVFCFFLFLILEKKISEIEGKKLNDVITKNIYVQCSFNPELSCAPTVLKHQVERDRM